MNLKFAIILFLYLLIIYSCDSYLSIASSIIIIIHQAHFNTQSLLHAPLEVELLKPVIANTWVEELYAHPLERLAPLSVTLLTAELTPRIVMLARGLVSLYVPRPDA
jgi:hypothetical protein